MAWYDTASFYHIYPLGLSGAPEWNDYGEPAGRLTELEPWIDHLAELGFDGLYIGPLFQSGSHGYDTTDYRLVDSRLGTNDDLRRFVARCHDRGVRVILDAVFNHTGRDFFAFRDLLANREGSAFRNWYRVDFSGNNSYDDGLRYETWGGCDLLAKLNLTDPAVRQYHLDSVRFWVETFDIDGLRLDAADVLDFGFMRELRQLADRIKPDFWLMGEVIHGEYKRWVNRETLHSVTNYRLHKGLYSAHNSHNYFEAAHTLEQLGPLSWRLYNFADNHDVERIATRLQDRRDYLPLHVMLFTLPGLPSVYYGSEFAVEGRKERGSDASLRPALRLEDFEGSPYAALIRRLNEARRQEPALRFGEYERLVLTTSVYAYARRTGGREALIAVNNGEGPQTLRLPARSGSYRSALTGETVWPWGGWLELPVEGHGAVLLLDGQDAPEEEAPVALPALPEQPRPAPAQAFPAAELPDRAPDKPLEEMNVPELQALILEKLAARGPVTDRMRREVLENNHEGSLRNWARSFR